jgi:hypothetical protein
MHNDPVSLGKLSEEVINENVGQAAAQQWLVRLATAEGLM